MKLTFLETPTWIRSSMNLSKQVPKFMDVGLVSHKDLGLNTEFFWLKFLLISLEGMAGSLGWWEMSVDML